jgi:NADH-quinone oxidoreductase subunit H
MGCVAYLTLWERKGIGFTQIRVGPNRVGPFGLLQPIADAVKLIFKEIIRPTAANKGLFFLGPVMTIMPALAAWAVVPFGPDVALANVNAGLLFLMAITSLEVYGVIIAGWASNSKYAFLGALRASAQMVSYEIAMGFALRGGADGVGSMNMTDIVMQQGQGHVRRQGPELPVLELAAAAAGLHRLLHRWPGRDQPPPLRRGGRRGEIVAGHMVEYSGMSFAMFFLAEYANMILVSIAGRDHVPGRLAAPIDSALFNWIPGWIWLAIKTFVVVSLFIWVRATFPRFRYDQIMRLGWKIFIPVTLVWLVVVGLDADALEHLEVGGRTCGCHLPSPFSIKDFFKSFMLTELLKGMAADRAYFFAARSRSSSRKRRRRCRRAFAACMRCAATTTAKSAASPASCARRCARRWPSPSSRTCVTTARAAPRATTST